jgi:transglutaminase-like putative cysteine protease
MKLHVSHRTEYVYEFPRSHLVQSLRLWPTEFEGQTLSTWSIAVEGHQADRGAAFRDGAGDWVETVSMRNVSAMAIVVEGEIETRDLSGVVRGLREKVPQQAYLRPTRATRLSEDLRALAREAIADADTPLDRAHAISRAVADAIVYTPGATEAGTTAAEALTLGQGVCQDQTHATIAMARAAAMPGRYVTGYLHSSADLTVDQASHAWAEIWVEGLGWVGFDAANRCCPDERYVRIASGLDAEAAAPIRGRALGGGEERLVVDVQVLDQQQRAQQSQSQSGNGQSQIQG